MIILFFVGVSVLFLDTDLYTLLFLTRMWYNTVSRKNLVYYTKRISHKITLIRVVIIRFYRFYTVEIDTTLTVKFGITRVRYKAS